MRILLFRGNIRESGGDGTVLYFECGDIAPNYTLRNCELAHTHTHMHAHALACITDEI